jgi:3-oxoacyl-[acyl-carrier protein] reductase
MEEMAQHLVVFGGSGAIGGAVVEAALALGWQVTSVARTSMERTTPGVRTLAVDPLAATFLASQLVPSTPYTSVCWAQGANTNDSVYDVDIAAHRRLYDVNCTYVLITLKALLDGAFLAPASRLCVISSIWQELARQSKLSYCVSKAALQGLVLSASADLARDRHLINAVLPGALETPMTRKNLTAEQIERLTAATGHRRLVTLEEVATAVCFLCSPANTGITGQFIAADLGFSRVRLV